MPERKPKKNISHQNFDDPEYFVLTEPKPIEIALGCSISVKYDQNNRPLVLVKKYGDVDVKGLRRTIERNYPGAIIKGLEMVRHTENNVGHERRTGRRSTHARRLKKRK